MTLISLVYVSFASHDLTDNELKDILEVSRMNNAAHSITGMLLYRDGFFIQALEGDDSVVEPLYEKIAADDRHSNVTLVYKEPISERSFNSWSMGFNKMTDEDVQAMPGLTDFLNDPHDVTFFTETPSRAAELLEAFKERTYF